MRMGINIKDACNGQTDCLHIIHSSNIIITIIITVQFVRKIFRPLDFLQFDPTKISTTQADAIIGIDIFKRYTVFDRLARGVLINIYGKREPREISELLFNGRTYVGNFHLKLNMKVINMRHASFLEGKQIALEITDFFPFLIQFLLKTS